MNHNERKQDAKYLVQYNFYVETVRLSLFYVFKLTKQ